MHLPSKNDVEEGAPPLFLIPGIEGQASIFENLTKNLRPNTLCLQTGYENVTSTIESMADSLYPVSIAYGRK